MEFKPFAGFKDFKPFQSITGSLRGGSDKVKPLAPITKPFQKGDNFQDDFDKQETRQRIGGGFSGAMKGAGQGAAMSGGNPYAAAAGAVIGAFGGQQRAKRSATEKFQDDRLAQLMQRSEDQTLGLTDVERQQLIGEQQAAARAQLQERSTDIARQQMASGGFSGQFGELQRQLASQEAAAGVKAAGVAEETSQNLAQQQRFQLAQGIKAREGREAGAKQEAGADQQFREQQFTDVFGDPDIREAAMSAGINIDNMSPAEQEAAMSELNTEFDLGQFDLAQGAGTLGGGI